MLNKLPIFRDTDDKKQVWDGIIMFFALYNCFSVPLKVVFQPDIMYNPIFQIMDGIIDFLFFVDIIVSFRQPYINDKGEEEARASMMAYQYIKTQFVVDLLATLPFELFVVTEANEGNEGRHWT